MTIRNNVFNFYFCYLYFFIIQNWPKPRKILARHRDGDRTVWSWQGADWELTTEQASIFMLRYSSFIHSMDRIMQFVCCHGPKRRQTDMMRPLHDDWQLTNRQLYRCMDLCRHDRRPWRRCLGCKGDPRRAGRLQGGISTHGLRLAPLSPTQLGQTMRT